MRKNSPLPWQKKKTEWRNRTENTAEFVKHALSDWSACVEESRGSRVTEELEEQTQKEVKEGRSPDGRRPGSDSGVQMNSIQSCHKNMKWNVVAGEKVSRTREILLRNAYAGNFLFPVLWQRRHWRGKMEIRLLKHEMLNGQVATKCLPDKGQDSVRRKRNAFLAGKVLLCGRAYWSVSNLGNNINMRLLCSTAAQCGRHLLLLQSHWQLFATGSWYSGKRKCRSVLPPPNFIFSISFCPLSPRINFIQLRSIRTSQQDAKQNAEHMKKFRVLSWGEAGDDIPQNATRAN